MRGEGPADGGEAGWSLSIVANKLEREKNRYQYEVCLAGEGRGTGNAYLKALELVGPGVPARDELLESSPGRPRAPPGPNRRPLLLREDSIDAGPRVTFELEVRLTDEPFRRLRSSMPTWLLTGWLKFPEKFRASPRPTGGRPPPGPPRWLVRAAS